MNDEKFCITNVEEAKYDYYDRMQNLSFPKKGKILSEIIEEPTLEC